MFPKPPDQHKGGSLAFKKAKKVIPATAPSVAHIVSGYQMLYEADRDLGEVMLADAAVRYHYLTKLRAAIDHLQEPAMPAPVPAGPPRALVDLIATPVIGNRTLAAIRSPQRILIRVQKARERFGRIVYSMPSSIPT